MPPILNSEDAIIGCTADASSVQQTSNTVWIIPVIVIAAVSLVATTIFLVLRQNQARMYRQACKNDPLLSKNEFLRRRKMTTSQRLREDEGRRKIIIRDALASKASKQLNYYP
jgi:hypothetical protein